jgi:hypothetical protein
MLNGTCHCGAVSITLQAPPSYMNDCNCSLCRKAGAVWGYYQSREVAVAGATRAYRRKDNPDPAVDLHFCALCGSTTHWMLTPAFVATAPDPQRMGVNMRLFDSEDLGGVELRYPDGKAWDGRSSNYGYYRAPAVLARGDGF